jgi:pyrimidine-specific ribonucleoside hydrolase
LPATSRRQSPIPAVDLLHQLIMDSAERVSLITLGPKTNLSLLLTRYPEVVTRLEQIIFMGGSASEAAPEFNVRYDPEAALEVIESAVPITMYGFDLFGQLAIDKADADRFRNHDHPAIRLTGELLCRHHSSSIPGDYLGLVGDAGAMVLFTNPGLFVARELPVRVNLQGVGRGQTIIDRPATRYDNSRRPNPSPMIDVVLDLDAAKAASAFVRTISAYAASANNHS